MLEFYLRLYANFKFNDLYVCLYMLRFVDSMCVPAYQFDYNLYNIAMY